MHKMKSWTVCLLCMAFISLFAGCSGKSEEAVEINIQDTVDAVFEAAGFSEELVKLEDDVLTNSYVLLDKDKVEEYAVYVSGSMGTPEELAIFKAVDEESVKGIREAVDRRVEDLKLNFEDYRPDEMPKIDNAVIVEKGNYVMLVICPNSEAAKETLEKL